MGGNGSKSSAGGGQGSSSSSSSAKASYGVSINDSLIVNLKELHSSPLSNENEGGGGRRDVAAAMETTEQWRVKDGQRNVELDAVVNDMEVSYNYTSNNMVIAPPPRPLPASLPPPPHLITHRSHNTPYHTHHSFHSQSTYHHPETSTRSYPP